LAKKKFMYRYLFLFLLLPFTTHAQDTVTIKRQATIIVHATCKGDYKTVIDYTYPALVQQSGGRAAMQKLITEQIKQLKDQGIISFDGSIGSPGRFYKAGAEIHCLLPENIIIRTSAGRYLARSYLLGISNNNGKSWAFLDVGNMPKEVLYRLLPDFNDDLKIPAAVKPEFLPN
jgi:hypothetical protein